MLLLLLSITDPDGNGQTGSLSDSDSGEGNEGSQLIEAAKRGNVEHVMEILSISPEKVISFYFQKIKI